MKRIFLYLFIAFIATACTKQAEPIVVHLWPEGAPSDNGFTQEEGDSVHTWNIVDPTLTVYVPERPTGQTILCCPGGAYGAVWHGTEGYNYGEWMNEQGITLAVLKYRMPNGNKDIPMEDVRKAMSILREHAEEWHVGQLGIMGFSAGGHLASTAATHWETEDERPDFQVLFYPVITMDTAYTHLDTRINLLGENPTEDVVEQYCNEKRVNSKTPEAFVVLSADDGLVPPRNGLEYQKALEQNGVRCTLLELPTGGHGWSGHPEFEYNEVWMSALEAWLANTRK